MVDDPSEVQMEYLRSLDELNYIEEVEFMEHNTKACIVLNGNFRKNYKADMEKTKKRLEFMDKYGDPLDSLNLTKSIVLWYPTYFIV